MKRSDLHYLISLLLILSICVTGVLGTIQAQFDLRKFVPHRYAAYATLSLALIHVCFNGSKLWRYLRHKITKRR